MNSVEKSSPLFFDWNATQVRLLCFGFVRKHLADHNIQIDDIVRIVHKNCTIPTIDIGLIHNKFYGQVSNTKNLLNLLTNEMIEDLTKKQHDISLQYNQNIDDSKLQSDASGVDVECPNCKCMGVAYDSYAVVSLPLPTRYRIFEFTWIGQDVVNPVVYGIPVLFNLIKLFFIYRLPFVLLYFCSRFLYSIQNRCLKIAPLVSSKVKLPKNLKWI